MILLGKTRKIILLFPMAISDEVAIGTINVENRLAVGFRSQHPINKPAIAALAIKATLENRMTRDLLVASTY
jgi:hypothetical protein